MPGVKRPNDADLHQFVTALEVIAERLLPVRRPQDAGAPECSLTELKALSILGRKRPLTVSDLAQEMNVTVSTATRTAEKLARKGLATRRRGPEDRRVVQIGFSAKGEEIQKYVTEARLAAVRAMLRSVPASRRRQFMEAVVRVAERARL